MVKKSRGEPLRTDYLEPLASVVPWGPFWEERSEVCSKERLTIGKAPGLVVPRRLTQALLAPTLTPRAPPPSLSRALLKARLHREAVSSEQGLQNLARCSLGRSGNQPAFVCLPLLCLPLLLPTPELSLTCHCSPLQQLFTPALPLHASSYLLLRPHGTF